MIVRTFSGYKPSPRIDGNPWEDVWIQESASPNGPWTTIEVVALAPLDPDPTAPLERSVMTENAVLESGWYRLVFVRGTQTDEPTMPVGAATATGFTAAMVRALFPTVDFAALGYPLPASGADPLEALVLEAVGYIGFVTGRVPLHTVPNDFEGGAYVYLPVARRAVAQRVVQLAFGFTGDNLTASASGVESFSVPGYSETRGKSAGGANAGVTNAWSTLWENIWHLMTAEKREEWEARQRGEDVPYFDIIDIDVPGAGLSDPDWGVWH